MELTCKALVRGQAKIDFWSIEYEGDVVSCLRRLEEVLVELLDNLGEILLAPWRNHHCQRIG